MCVCVRVYAIPNHIEAALVLDSVLDSESDGLLEGNVEVERVCSAFVVACPNPKPELK